MTKGTKSVPMRQAVYLIRRLFPSPAPSPVGAVMRRLFFKAGLTGCFVGRAKGFQTDFASFDVLIEPCSRRSTTLSVAPRYASIPFISGEVCISLISCSTTSAVGFCFFTSIAPHIRTRPQLLKLQHQFVCPSSCGKKGKAILSWQDHCPRYSC